MLNLKIRSQTWLCVLLLTQSCQSPGDPQPAKITGFDRALLMASLEEAVGRSGVSIFPEEPIGAQSLSVPPPRLGQYETHSPALPTRFDVVLDKGACLLVNQATGMAYKIEQLSCVPVSGKK